MKNKWYWLFILTILLLVVTLTGLWWKYETLEHTLETKDRKENQSDTWSQFDKVKQAYEIITSNYVDRIEGSQLT